MATTKGALEKSIFFQKLVLKESADPKQKERARKAIEKLQTELDAMTKHTSNPTKRKFSPAQLAAQKLFAERSRSGALKKSKPGVKTVKRNPDKAKPKAYVRRVSQATGEAPNKRLIARRKKALTGPAGYFPNPKVSYKNTAKELKGEQRIGYSVHLASNPPHTALGWFSKKADAVAVATEAANRTGKQLAVSRMQTYFGAL